MFPGLFLLRMMRKGVTEMAATRLIALHANKGKTIARSLSDRTDYAKNPDKTEKGELVTGYQCDPFTVDEEFMLTKQKYEQITGRHQRRDVIAYQIRQSFKPGEITPEEANRLGHFDLPKGSSLSSLRHTRTGHISIIISCSIRLPLTVQGSLRTSGFRVSHCNV